MRTLALTPIRFDILYGGLLSSQRGFSRKEGKMVDAILTTLEAVGVEGANGLYALAEEQSVQLEEAEFQFLKEVLSEIKWSAIGSRKAVPVLDWLDDLKDLRIL